MTQPYMGQIQPYAFNFAPKNWAFCNGQVLPVAQNQALFSLLGTVYGGNGVTTFALPNLQSRVPMHQGRSDYGETFTPGEASGVEQITLNTTQMPMHNHLFMGTTADGAATLPQTAGLMGKASGGSGDPDSFYGPDSTLIPLNAQTIGMTGGNQAHTNLEPYLTINWCICLYGIFPSRN